MAASPPPRGSKSKPGGNKAALQDAFDSSKAELGGGPEGPEQEGTPSDLADDQQEGGDVSQLEMQLQHLQSLLISKGIISPHDVMQVPQIAPPPDPTAAPPGAPPAPGAPAGPPPGGMQGALGMQAPPSPFGG